MELIRELTCRVHMARPASILSGISTPDQGPLILYRSVCAKTRNVEPVMKSRDDEVCVYSG